MQKKENTVYNRTGTNTRRNDLQLRNNSRKRRRRRMLINRAIILAPVVIIVLIIIICLIPKNNGEDKMTQTTETEPMAVKVIETAAGVAENKVDFEFTKKTFSSEDTELLNVRHTCECSLDTEALITEPLDWDMTADDFTVLIMHSHISESYTKSDGEVYIESSDFRTENSNYNMTVIGNVMEEALKKYGINVIHDTTSYEYPDSDYAYTTARVALNERLSADPSIKLVIDLHRDAADLSDGTAWGPTITVDGKETAMVSFVVGTACEVSENPHWRQNMAYTSKLEAQLEKMYPGFCRQTLVSAYQYNQDLDATFLLAEVGLAGNTLEEAENAALCLSKGIAALAKGTTE